MASRRCCRLLHGQLPVALAGFLILICRPTSIQALQVPQAAFASFRPTMSWKTCRISRSSVTCQRQQAATLNAVSHNQKKQTVLLRSALAASLMLVPSIASAAGKSVVKPIASTLISGTDEWSLWLVLFSCATAGLMAEKTKVGAALSSPLVTMLLTLLLCNIGVIPFDAPLYSAVNRFLVPMAVPLLLFSADLKRVVADTGRLLIAFFVGAFASIASTIIAAYFIPMRGLEGAWKFAAALCSRHIGGAINYVAVSEVLQTPPAMVTAGIAADNFVVAVYFITIFALANSRLPQSSAPSSKAPAAGTGTTEVAEEGSKSFSLTQLTLALSTALLICWTSLRLETLMGLDGWSIPIATAVVIAAATAFPKQLAPLQGAGEAAGVLFMQIFFAATGASGSIRLVLQTAPALFAFSAAQVVIHVIILLGIGWLWHRAAAGAKGEKFRESMLWNELLLASNANVGGPTTAAGMAAAKQWKSLVVPAILIGVLGYAIATFLSIVLGRVVLRPLMA